MTGETAAGMARIRAAAVATAAAAVVDPRDDANLGAPVCAGRERMERDAWLTSNPRADWGEQSWPNEEARVSPKVPVDEGRATGKGSDREGEGEGDDSAVDMSILGRAGAAGEAGATDRAGTIPTIVSWSRTPGARLLTRPDRSCMKLGQIWAQSTVAKGRRRSHACSNRAVTSASWVASIPATCPAVANSFYKKFSKAQKPTVPKRKYAQVDERKYSPRGEHSWHWWQPPGCLKGAGRSTEPAHSGAAPG